MSGTDWLLVYILLGSAGGATSVLISNFINTRWPQHKGLDIMFWAALWGVAVIVAITTT